MMESTKIYIVKSCYGRYDDYHEVTDCAFTSHEAAVQYAQKIEESHHQYDDCGRIVPNDWDAVIELVDSWLNEDFINFCNEHNIALNENNEIIDWKSSEDVIHKHNEKLQTKIPEKYLQYLTLVYPEEHYTMTDVMQYMEYLNHKYDNWMSCKIEEIELFN